MKYLYIIPIILLFGTVSIAKGAGHKSFVTVNYAEKITVKGKVVDENGQPIIGATIQQAGASVGTVSDADGKFSLSVPSDAKLIISYMGYKKVEIDVKNKENIGTIALKPASKELDQLVVIGYGTQRKVDLTGSVSVVDADDLKKVSSSNISTMLEGKVPGVRVTTDGQPGADPVVRIHGIGSFGNTSPLYVVDGVPVGTTIRDFSPNDIASIQILKDASAAAIYGSRAANGVVIITTKEGKKNQALKIDYSGYVGFDQVHKGIYDVMNSKQYGQYINMAFANSGMDVPDGYNPSSSKYIDPNVVNTDWFDAAFKTGVRQDHNISLSGGGKNNTYYVGLDYFDQKGTMVGAGPNYKRYTARIKNTMDVKFIKLKTNLVYSHSNQDNMSLSNANEFVQGLYGAQYPVMASVLITPPTIKAYDESTWVLDDKVSAAGDYPYDSYGFGTYYDDVHGDLRVTNLLLTNSLLKRNSKVSKLVATGTADVDLIDMIGQTSKNHHLSYKLNLSYSKTYVKDFTFVPAFIQSTTNYLAKENETLSEGYRNYTDGLIENTLNYSGKIGLNNIDAVVGQTFERELFHTLTGRGVNFPEPYYLQIGNAKNTYSGTSESEHVLASYIGRLNYNYDEKYLFSATVRRDGSSRLSSKGRWGWFPSVSAGWRIEKEKFFPISNNTVNLFKIRGSYGVLGNENIGDYQYMNVMSRGNYTYSFGNKKVTGSAISDYVNTGIRWEKKKTLDLGLDIGMLNSQFEFTLDWYRAISEDLLYSVAVPTNAGVTNSTVTMNAATMVNSGLELSAAYHHRKSEIKYDIRANVSTLSNKVTKLGVSNEPRTDGNSRTEVGREVGSFYGYVYEGIFQSQKQIDNRVNEKGDFVSQPGAQPGDVAYADLNNDGKITDADQKFLGSGLPKINFGLSGNISWKGFNLSISTYGAAMFKAVDFVGETLRGSYGMLNKSKDLLNAWTPENKNTDVPRVAYKSTGSITNDMFSQRFIQDASYFKIANIQLGYNFPDRWFNSYIHDVRLYVSAQNLTTFTKYKGYNVDFAGGTFTPGFNYASYPTPRTVMFGINLSF